MHKMGGIKEINVMGMYTEFHFNVELRRETPQEVIDALQIMLGESRKDYKKYKFPEHSLFQCDRFMQLFTGDSAYFPMISYSTLEKGFDSDQLYLSVRANLKNYDEEIEKFIDWISPYLDHFPGDFLGFYRYEETEEPTLIHYTGEIENES